MPIAVYDLLTGLARESDSSAGLVAKRLLVDAIQKPDGGDGQYPITRAVEKDLEALITGHPMGEALSAMAVNLARTLDAGAGLIEASVNRELRETLAALAEAGDTGDGIDDPTAVPPEMVNPEDDI